MKRSGNGGREKANEADRRAVVLTAAVAVFAARGLEAGALAEIARDAEVSVGWLEQEFGGTEALARRAVREVARAHVAGACSGLPPGPAIEQLRNFCGRNWEVLHTPTFAALDRLWVAEAARFPDLARIYAEEVHRPLHATLVAIIERGIAEGQFRPVAPAPAARVVLAALLKQAFWCNHSDGFGPAVGGCKRVVAETLSLLLGGLTV